MKRVGFIICFSLLFFIAFAQKNVQEINGRVFLDANHNGVFDLGEKGLKGIPVSNGDTIVITSRKGEFILPVDSTSSIFPILPSGFEITGSKIGNSNFFHVGNKIQSEKATFGLVKKKQPTHFTVGAIGDVQVENRQEFNYANNSIFAELATSTDINFNIFLGDLVNDNVEDLSVFRETLERLPNNSWTVAGNHDRNEIIGRYQQSFNRFFGATDYAFNYGNVHFIVLNNVYPTGKRGYEGRFTAKQLRFVKNDLALIPANYLIVIAQHIPMVSVKNKEEFISLFENRKNILILSGHTHRVGRHYLAQNIMEIVAGASCGNWWTGELDWLGIPSALMQCGSPRNYFVIDFEKGDYSFRFKGVGLDASKQMTIFVGGQDSLNILVPALSKLDSDIIIANVYAGSEKTQVRMQIDNGDWIVMQKADLADPNVVRNIELNNLDIYPTTFSKKAALRPSNSPHIWQAKLPGNLSKGTHVLKIEASEPNGFFVSESEVFQVH